MEFKEKHGDKGIMTMPGKGMKRPSLYLRRGDSIVKVATFTSHEAMETTEMYINALLEGDNVSI